MYHTFQASAATGDSAEAEGKERVPGGSRRISTSNACVECRRRKIRCDGAQPCGQCQWYQHPELCTYSKPTQRVVPSRKLVDKLQLQVDQSYAIFSRLFPGQDLHTLISLPREELINLAVTLPAPSTSPSTNSEPTPAIGHELTQQKSEGAESLEALEQAPEQDPEIDEARRHKDKVQGISDDVNGLSLSVDKQSSYVGVSSISAALKVIFKTAPVARSFVVQNLSETALPSRSNTPPPQTQDPDPTYLPPADIGHKLIEWYFAHVHILMPMIDEDQFWHTYLYGERGDSPWLALLNIVMALGSLSGSTCDNEDHIAYFQRSRKHLDLETFGSGNLLVLQALGLLSGYYLHWLNRPNEANCLMGATLRMATALGLHREYERNDGHTPGSSNGQVIRTGAEVPVEIRRRTWWSLFCLDTWGSMTTGRPSLGRLGPGITVRRPKIPEQMNNAQYLASLKLLPIIHNIEFCKLATRVQDTVAARSLCKFEELFSLDAELVKWHDDLPPILRDLLERPKPRQRSNSKLKRISGNPVTPSEGSTWKKKPFDFSQPPDRDHTACPEVLKTPRAIMHWRYQNLRILMHRPFLLAAALRRTSYTSMSAEEKLAVGRCRIIAGQTIADINATCQEELIAGWNAVWLMYQAVMVPLVSLFSYLSSPATYIIDGSPRRSVDNSDGNAQASTGGDEDVDRWQHQIETAMQFFNRMRRYSVAAKKSKDVVERLYEASKHVTQFNEQQSPQQKVAPQQYQQHLNPGRAFDSGSSAADPFFGSGIANIAFGSPQASENVQFGQGVWGLSPNGDAAMNSFWDDMMWETFPEMPETSSWIPGLDQFDWMPPNGQPHESSTSAQHWSHWQVDEQQR